MWDLRLVKLNREPGDTGENRCNESLIDGRAGTGMPIDGIKVKEYLLVK